jgi:predicted ArsR family transcriptional regulator
MDWQRLARANTHPLRISVMEVLEMDSGRTLSPSDLSYELKVPLSNVNYHVTELLRSGLIELASQRQVRGATEHFYRVVDQQPLTRDDEGKVLTAVGNGSGNGHSIATEPESPWKRAGGLQPAAHSQN